MLKLKLLSAVLLLAVLVSIPYACTKNSSTKSSQNPTSPVTGVEEDRAKAIEISNDPAWKNMRKTQNEMLALLHANGVDPQNEHFFEENYVYSKLGKDAEVFKSKFIKTQEFANQVRSKYFLNDQTCISCNEITPEKKARYRKMISNIFAKANAVKKTTLATTSSEYGFEGYEGPGCWNVSFFACGALCTAIANPLFFACIYLCYCEYCEGATCL
jgi:hypothetical protein